MADNPSYPIGTASVSWFDKNGQLNIRVYSTDGYTVTEQYNAGNGWLVGATFPGSNVSATVWSDSEGEHIRVYATFQDTTTEWCNDPSTGWTKGSYTQP
jgi:hypothetical protein